MRQYGNTWSPCSLSEDELYHAHGRSTLVMYGGCEVRINTPVRLPESSDRGRKLDIFSRLRSKRKAADPKGR